MKKSLFNKLAAPSKADAHQELAAVAVGNGKDCRQQDSGLEGLFFPAAEQTSHGVAGGRKLSNSVSVIGRLRLSLFCPLRSGLGKARPWAKRLSWQTPGGWVK